MYKTQDIFLSTASTNCKRKTRDRWHISEACARYEAAVKLQTGIKKESLSSTSRWSIKPILIDFGLHTGKYKALVFCALTCFASI